jgi:hypothetical protein
MKPTLTTAILLMSLLTTAPALAGESKGPLILPNQHEQERREDRQQQRDDLSRGEHCVPSSPPPGRSKNKGPTSDCTPGDRPEGSSGQPTGAAVSTPQMGSGKK